MDELSSFKDSAGIQDLTLFLMF
ncbi:hypothetical protein LINPERHAP2_LOCUS9629 [Linum perenne]